VWTELACCVKCFEIQLNFDFCKVASVFFNFRQEEANFFFLVARFMESH